MTSWRHRLRGDANILDPGRSAPTAPGLLAAMLLLAALAAIYFLWPVYRAFLPLQIDYNDAWNAYHADAIGAGQPLYPLDDFIANNYPPLSFYLVSALSAVTGFDAVFVGRALSLAATIVTALAVWACIRQLGGSRLGASLGALWWLATMARWYSTWIGMNDPHLVALAVMTCGLAYALRYPTSSRAYLAIVVMAIAGFYKHNLVVTPAAALFWLSIHDRGRGLRATAIGLGTVAFGLVVCGAVFGPAFFHDMLLPRHFEIYRLGSIGRSQFVAPGLIIACIWAVNRRRTPAGRFVLFFAVLAFISFAVQSLADGVADNAIFELAVAAAVGVGCAFDDLVSIPIVRRWGLERTRIVIVCILIARLLLSQSLTPYLLLFSPAFRASLNERVSIMKAEIARIAEIPGPVVCTEAMVCRLAGKPFVLDPFVLHEYIVTGRLSRPAVDARVRDRKIRFDSVDPRVSVMHLE
jgi:hypothetical protein